MSRDGARGMGEACGVVTEEIMALVFGRVLEKEVTEVSVSSGRLEKGITCYFGLMFGRMGAVL